MASPFHAQDEIISDCGGENERGDDYGEEEKERKKEERDEGRRKEPSIIKYDWSLLSFGVMI